MTVPAEAVAVAAPEAVPVPARVTVPTEAGAVTALVSAARVAAAAVAVTVLVTVAAAGSVAASAEAVAVLVSAIVATDLVAVHCLGQKVRRHFVKPGACHPQDTGREGQTTVGLTLSVTVTETANHDRSRR